MIKLTQTQKEFLIGQLEMDVYYPEAAEELMQKEGAILTEEDVEWEEYITPDEYFKYSIGFFTAGNRFVELDCISPELYAEVLTK